MSRSATIRSLPQAFEMIKEMEAQGHEFGDDYREAGRRALARRDRLVTMKPRSGSRRTRG